MPKIKGLRSVGIVGAGQMGTGMALLFSSIAKLRVKLVDTSEPPLAKSYATMENWLVSQLVKRRLTLRGYYNILQRISVSTDLKDLRRYSFVIETATENLDKKAKLLREISKTVGKKPIIATNTMSIPISEFVSHVSRPKRFIGMHFFNPPTTMKRVEITPSEVTSYRALKMAQGLAKISRKKAVVSKDRPGFLTTKITSMFINEAILALDQRVGPKEMIDDLIRNQLKVPLGPLEEADFIGLDTVLETLKNFEKYTGDDKFAPAPLLEAFVKANWLGRKTGKGFYTYDVNWDDIRV